MKTVPLIFLISFFLVTGFSYSVPQSVTEEITAAIRAADDEKLAIYFNNTVDISLPNNEGTYSKNQAQLIIKDFFSKTPPDSFEIDHEGSSNNGSLYLIGSYKSTNKTYRVYILIKKISGKYLIQQLQFEDN
ncbi:MAG: DUF4783 domain-containing protein [Bacteroidales bacterium]|nr:DUF4783 domain-containing protein [Bacteroidales bacterium]